MKKPGFERAEKIFFYNGGMLPTSAALNLGIHPATLYAMEKAGILKKLSRGLFRLSDLPPLEQPDLVAISIKAPKAVVCLASALHFHGLSAQAPDQIHLALKRGMEPPRLSGLSVRRFWFSPFAFNDGIETYEMDGARVRIYGPEKTLADCFKYRNKLGLDLALEALKRYRDRGAINRAELMRYAQICRVQKVMQPYLEAIL